MGKTGEVIWGVIGKAASHRLALAATGATAASGIVLQSGVLFAMAIGGYAAAFGVNVGRRQLWRKVLRELELEPVELPCEISIEDAAARSLLRRLAKARADRAVVLQAVQARTAIDAQGTAIQVVALERQAMDLIRALDRLGPPVDAANTAALRGDLVRLQSQAQITSNTLTRTAIEEATTSLQERIEAIAQIESWRILATARLEAIIAALETLPYRLARADAWNSTMRSIQDDSALARLREEVERLDQGTRATETTFGCEAMQRSRFLPCPLGPHALFASS